MVLFLVNGSEPFSIFTLTPALACRPRRLIVDYKYWKKKDVQVTESFYASSGDNGQLIIVDVLVFPVVATRNEKPRCLIRSLFFFYAFTLRATIRSITKS